MKNTKHRIVLMALAGAITTLAITSCGKKGDAINTAEKADKEAGITAPSIEETKAIAEEGFIYGLPIVMNYAVMNEYAVNKDSGQFKAPFNHILNEPRVFTYKDTAIITPNSDTPYSLAWLDLRAEPIVLSVPAVDKDRYFSVMLCDGNTYNYGYIGSRATGNEPGDYMVVGPDWKGEKPEGIKKVFTSTTPFTLAAYRTQLFKPDDMPNVIKVQDGYKVQPLSSFLKQTRASRRTEDRLPPGHYRWNQGKLLPIPRRRARVHPAVGRQQGDSRQTSAASAWVPARPLTSRISPWNTRPPSSSR